MPKRRKKLYEDKPYEDKPVFEMVLSGKWEAGGIVEFVVKGRRVGSIRLPPQPWALAAAVALASIRSADSHWLNSFVTAKELVKHLEKHGLALIPTSQTVYRLVNTIRARLAQSGMHKLVGDGRLSGKQWARKLLQNDGELGYRFSIPPERLRLFVGEVRYATDGREPDGSAGNDDDHDRRANDDPSPRVDDDLPRRNARRRRARESNHGEADGPPRVEPGPPRLDRQRRKARASTEAEANGASRRELTGHDDRCYRKRAGPLGNGRAATARACPSRTPAPIPMKYFAYGSNCNPAIMKKKGVRFHGAVRGELAGYRLLFNKRAMRENLPPGIGFANINVDPTGTVEGILYDILDEDLEHLDRSERYPEHYTRIDVTVRAGGEEIACTSYQALPDKVAEGLIPSRNYLNHILAAKDFLSRQYYEALDKSRTYRGECACCLRRDEEVVFVKEDDRLHMLCQSCREARLTWGDARGRALTVAEAEAVMNRLVRGGDGFGSVEELIREAVAARIIDP